MSSQKEALAKAMIVASLAVVVPCMRPEAAEFIRGDVDANGALEITDSVRIFTFLFVGGQEIACQDAADANDSGVLDITDGIYLLNFLFRGGGAPPAPFPDCGADESEDSLGCERHGPCKSVSGIEIDLDTSGGFTGWGSTDYQVRDGVLTVHNPFGDPEDCSAPLTQVQMERLLEATAAVDWDEVEPSYRPPENPHCCCDQIITDFRIAFVTPSGETVAVTTNWCDESMFAGRLPHSLLALLDVLEEIGTEVAKSCAQRRAPR